MKIEEQPYDDRHDPGLPEPAYRNVSAQASHSLELSFHWPNGYVSPTLGRASVGDLRSIDTVDLMTLQAHLERAATVVRRAIEARR